MSAAFKVGDRVMCTCGAGARCTVRGRVIGIDDDGSTRVSCDNGEEVTWRAKYLDPVAPTPAGAVAPMAVGDLVHPSGVKVKAGPAFQIASSGGAGYYTGLGGYIGVTGTLRAAPSWTSPNLDDLRRDMAELMTARGDLLAARDEHRAMRAALDTVRKFLGAHSFASCSLACNRELREVMAVVLEALDAGKAGK